MMRRPHIYMTCLLITVSILLIIDIKIRYTDKTYVIPIGSQENKMIFRKLKTFDETNAQQIPKILDDDIHLSIKMEKISEISTEKFSCGDPNTNEMDTILQDKTPEITDNITNILLEKARLKIKYDTSNFNFSQSGVNVLEDLVMESGGQPQRSLIVSTWRSGSTFLGDLIRNARPGTYYVYEPLLKYGIKQFKTPEEATEPVSFVKQMFQCNSKGLQDIYDCERLRYRVGKPSTRIWDYCKFGNNTELCFNADFGSRLCKLFPFQSMKLIRLRLRPVQEILDDKKLNVKVVLLVRDPRGVMQSRLHHHFCKLSPDCWDPSMVCADMVSDYEAARRLLQQYPDRLMVLRFEELALKINETSDQILNFLKIERTQVFDDFLQTHTNVETAGAFTTFRVSKNVPYKWTTALNFSYVNAIQMACSEAMDLWGYKMALNETHMTSNGFNPVDDYTIYQRLF